MHEELLKVTNELYTVSNELTCPVQAGQRCLPDQNVSAVFRALEETHSPCCCPAVQPACPSGICWECRPLRWCLTAAEEDFPADLP